MGNQDHDNVKVSGLKAQNFYTNKPFIPKWRHKKIDSNIAACYTLEVSTEARTKKQIPIHDKKLSQQNYKNIERNCMTDKQATVIDFQFDIKNDRKFRDNSYLTTNELCIRSCCVVHSGDSDFGKAINLSKTGDILEIPSGIKNHSASLDDLSSRQSVRADCLLSTSENLSPVETVRSPVFMPYTHFDDDKKTNMIEKLPKSQLVEANPQKTIGNCIGDSGMELALGRSFEERVEEKIKKDIPDSSAFYVEQVGQPNKTPSKNTLLDYFVRSGNKTKQDSAKPVVKLSSLKNEKPNPSHQLTLTNKRISPDSNSNYPFDLPASLHTARRKKRKRITLHTCKRAKVEQTYIDIGQKDFGHITCETCGMIYTKCQEDDEAQHARYHQKVVATLKFKGWKNERVVQEFPDGRVIAIYDSDNHLHKKKLVEIKDVVDSELGFSNHQDIPPSTEQKAYLFIASKKVVGCCIALAITKAFPVITSAVSNLKDVDSVLPTSSWCCSGTPVSALCGISRIWVFSQSRRQNIASRLVDTVRHNFIYGCVVPKRKVAFSDPTPNGRAFAEKYIGSKGILVFR